MGVVDLNGDNQVLIAVTQLQTQVGIMSEQLKEISKIGQSVVEVVESNKVAHNRIDDLKSDFEKSLAAEKKAREEAVAAEVKARQDAIAAEAEDRKEIAEGLKWVWRALGTGGITLIVGILLFYTTN